jgi:hypothetical protein
LVTCFTLLAATRAGLSLLGLQRTLGLVKRVTGRSRAGVARGSATETARAVATAAAFFPGRAVCLEQSIALYLLLRRRGFHAALRIGVQPYPFQAHAWVELDGEPLNETEEMVRKFVAFPRVFA